MHNFENKEWVEATTHEFIFMIKLCYRILLQQKISFIKADSLCSKKDSREFLNVCWPHRYQLFFTFHWLIFDRILNISSDLYFYKNKYFIYSCCCVPFLLSTKIFTVIFDYT